MLQTEFSSRDEAIAALAEKLNLQGKLHDKDEYLQAVMAREAQGTTALGEGLYFLTEKSDAVREAAYAVATLKKDLSWQGLDDDEEEDVNIIFLLAIPNSEAGSTHMTLLTKLTTTLVDDDVREAVLKATTVDEFVTIMDGSEEEEEAEEIAAPLLHRSRLKKANSRLRNGLSCRYRSHLHGR